MDDQEPNSKRTTKSSKNGKVNRLASLFEIPRPQKSRGLQRTNSLPLGGKSRGDEETRNSLRKTRGSAGKVRKIREEIESKQVQRDVKQWQTDKEKIMEDVTKLKEKIEEIEEDEVFISEENVKFQFASLDEESEDSSEDSWMQKSFVLVNNEESSPEIHRRFAKNPRSLLNTSKRRAGIIKKPYTVKELTQRFEGFKEAAENGETESYRQSVIDEMDLEYENMLMDGFTEDELRLSLENLTIIDDDDIYGETLADDLMDDDMYYLEAWNCDGKELVMCRVMVDRKSVDINSFDSMKTNSNILMEEEQALVLLGDYNFDSKRNTMYSTTSGESFEDEDEKFFSPARRETICDNQGIVRIERVAPFDAPPDSEYTVNVFYEGESQPPSATEEDDNSEDAHIYESIRLQHDIMFKVPEVKKDTLQYITDEIECTERKYVHDLKRVLHNYKKFLEERCPEKVDIVFANLNQIYTKQIQFLEALEACKGDITAIAKTFIQFETLFKLYPRYFKNTPRANAAVKELGFLLKEKQERIQDKLDLSAYLLTPLQRLGKYKLFLENIIKQLEKADRPTDLVQMALDMMKKFMSQGNDAVAVASILHSPLHTKDYGPFIAREKFTLLKPKKFDVMVFLFEAVIVFAIEDAKNLEQFEYYQSIRTNDLRIATFDHDHTIQLTDFTKTKKRNSSKYTYVLDTRNDKTKEVWKKQIEEILWNQMMKIKESTIREYQNGTQTVHRIPTRSREQRAKTTGKKAGQPLFGNHLHLYR